MTPAPAQLARRTRAAHRRGQSQPLVRDEGLRLAQLEHAITSRLAKRAELEHCAQLSERLDGVHASERLDGLAAITEDDIAAVLVRESERMDALRWSITRQGPSLTLTLRVVVDLAREVADGAQR